MTAKTVAMMLAALTATACDRIGEAMDKVVPARSVSTTDNDKKETQPSGATAGADTNLEKPFKTLEQAMQLSVFDVTLDLPVEQVKALLLEKGFGEPRLPPMVAGLDTYEASIGYNCAFKYSGTDEGICDKIGHVQETGYIWTRGTLANGEPEETVLPLFYVDENKQLRLWHMGYERAYAPEVFPGTIADQMIERFGAPTVRFSSETRDELSYYVQMNVPRGYEKTDTDTRHAGRFELQREIRNNRIDCLKQAVEEFPTKLSAQCKKIFSEPAKPQQIFDALGSSSNEVLSIAITPDRLRLQLTAHFLYRAVVLALEEKEIQAELAELERRRDAGGDVADDL